jgi:hypothetical protein
MRSRWLCRSATPEPGSSLRQQLGPTGCSSKDVTAYSGGHIAVTATSAMDHNDAATMTRPAHRADSARCSMWVHKFWGPGAARSRK